MPRIAVINNAEPEIRKFAQALEEIIANRGYSSIVLEYAHCPEYDFNKIDGVILSGSPQGDDIVENHLPYYQWLKDFEKPVLGICAGHHVVGFMFGASLLRSEEPESGNCQVQLLKPDPLFKNLPRNIQVQQMHNDSITLPNNFELLASSNICKNQLMKHKSKALYTCQFHPEFYNHQLIQNFIALCK